MSGLIGREDPDDVTIDTPAGSIGIRGTTVAGDVDAGEIMVLDGAIVLRAMDGSEMVLAIPFETARFGGGDGGGIVHIGQTSAEAFSQRFHSIRSVAGSTFNSVDAAAQEEQNAGSEDNQDSDDGTEDPANEAQDADANQADAEGQNAEGEGGGEPGDSEPGDGDAVNGGEEGNQEMQGPEGEGSPEGEGPKPGPGGEDPLLAGPDGAGPDGPGPEGPAPDGGDPNLAGDSPDGPAPEGSLNLEGGRDPAPDGSQPDGTAGDGAGLDGTGSGLEGDSTFNTGGRDGGTGGSDGTAASGGGTTGGTGGTTGGTTTTNTAGTTNTDTTTTTSGGNEPLPPLIIGGPSANVLGPFAEPPAPGTTVAVIRVNLSGGASLSADFALVDNIDGRFEVVQVARDRAEIRTSNQNTDFFNFDVPDLKVDVTFGQDRGSVTFDTTVPGVTNGAPQQDGSVNFTGDEASYGSDFTADVSGLFTDPDDDSLTFSYSNFRENGTASTQPAFMTLDANGNVIVNVPSTVGAGAPGADTTYSMDVTATDEAGQTVVRNVQFTVYTPTHDQTDGADVVSPLTINTDNFVVATKDGNDSVSLDGNGKNGRVFLGNGNDDINVTDVENVKIYAENGDDKIYVSNSGDAGNAQVYGGDGNDSFTYDQSSGAFRGYKFFGENGDDYFNVDVLGADGKTVVDGGEGTDELDLTGTNNRFHIGGKYQTEVKGVEEISMDDGSNTQMLDIDYDIDLTEDTLGNKVEINMDGNDVLNIDFDGFGFKLVSGDVDTTAAGNAVFEYNDGTDTHTVQVNYAAGADLTTSVTDNFPYIKAIYPHPEMEQVAHSESLEIIFTETVAKNLTGGPYVINIRRVSDDALFETMNVTSPRVTVDGDRVTINPNGILVSETEYYVEIAAGAFVDTNDNAFEGISDKSFWQFTTGANTFAVSVGGANADELNDVIEVTGSNDPTPSYVAVGHATLPGSNQDILIHQINELGDVEQVLNIGTSGANDEARAILQSSVSDLFIAGVTAGAGQGGNDALLMRISPDGEEIIFANTVGTTNNEEFNTLAETADGDIVAAGKASDGTNDDLLIASFDNAGATNWQNAISRQISAADVDVEVVEIINTTGAAFDNGGVNDLLILSNIDLATTGDINLTRIDHSDGSVVWTRDLQIANTQEAKAMYQNNSGDVVIAGNDDSSGDGLLINVDIDGAGNVNGLNYAFAFNPGASINVTSVLAAADNNVIVVGYTPGGDIFVGKFSAANLADGTVDGNEVQYAHVFDSGADDYSAKASLAADGGIIISGQGASNAVGANDGYVIKVNASGNIVNLPGGWTNTDVSTATQSSMTDMSGSTTLFDASGEITEVDYTGVGTTTDNEASFERGVASGANVTQDLLAQDAGDEATHLGTQSGGVTDRGEAKMYTTGNLNSTAIRQFDAFQATDGANNDFFGSALDINVEANVVVVAANGNDTGGTDRGAVYIYDLLNGNQLQKIQSADIQDSDGFGGSVAVDGDLLIVGAEGEDTNGGDSGAAYVFHHNGSNFVQASKLLAGDGLATDAFGESVAVDGNFAIVGASGNDHTALSNPGAAYIYDLTVPASPVEIKLTAGDPEAFSGFGKDVAISGNFAMVGALDHNNAGSDQGAVYIFERNTGGANNWGQYAKIVPAGISDSDQFGSAVAIDGNVMVVGAQGDSASAGAAYIYRFDGSSWNEEAKIVGSGIGGGDLFGADVAISGGKVIIGADGADKSYVFEDQGGGSWSEIKVFDGASVVAISDDFFLTGNEAYDEAGDHLNTTGGVDQDVAAGFGGHDEFVIDGGGDIIRAGEGDDDITLTDILGTNGDGFVHPDQLGIIDGEGGFDRLLVRTAHDFDLRMLDVSEGLNLANIEVLDLHDFDDERNVIEISLESVIDMTDENNVLVIEGNDKDEVRIFDDNATFGNFTDHGDTNNDGLREFTFDDGDGGTAALLIDADINVNIVA